MNPFESKKDSLIELAIKIASRNLEKKELKAYKGVKRKKRKNKKVKTDFNVVKMNDGTIVHFIPPNMKEKGYKKKVKENMKSIMEFIDSENSVLKL